MNGPTADLIRNFTMLVVLFGVLVGLLKAKEVLDRCARKVHAGRARRRPRRARNVKAS